MEQLPDLHGSLLSGVDQVIICGTRVSMSTGELSQDQSFYAAGIFNPFSMKGISPDGFVHDAKPGSCLDFTGAMPNQILPNSKYSGHVEVVLPESVISIAAASIGTGSKSRGWVWPIS